MINFACKCGHKFCVLDDMSGGTVQCPDCRLLVDVPYLGDRGHIEEDGTFKIEEVPLKDEEEQRISELKRTYLRRSTDDDGEEYDLRPTPEEIMRAGYEETHGEDGLVEGTPKYDPETGELIRPMALKQPQGPRPEDIPVAKAAISYATLGLDERVSPGMVPLRLLMPTNAFVLFLVFFAHLVNQFFVVAVAGGMFLVVLAPVLICLVVWAHYGCVVDEIAVAERDELPTPLRGMSLGDDFWWPMVQYALASFICYGPAGYAFVHATLYTSDLGPGLIPALLLAVAGSVAFPAVLLTAVTSGSMHNLRADRVFGVMIASGAAYAGIVVLWLITSTLYLASLIAVTHHGVSLLQSPSGSKLDAILPYIAYPMLFVSIYLVHLFLWYLGLLYRAHHNEFPWVLQRHIPSLKVERKFQQLRREKAQQGESAPARVPPRNA